MDKIDELGKHFSRIVEYYNTYGENWKGIPEAHKAFELMKDKLPLRVKGELTPYTRIVLLNNMLDCLHLRDCARFMKEVREYQLSMFPLIAGEDIEEDMDIDHYEGEPAGFVRATTEKDIRQAMKKIDDYLDPGISMEDWCRTYHVTLKFDPVERTTEWENVICEVEAECEKILKDEPRGMGFCFSYWSTKKSVLAKKGIEWASPGVMNPRVMFD